MKKSKYLILGLILCLYFTGCKDWLDVNHNPNQLEEVSGPDVLMPAAQVGIANNLMGWDFGFGGGFWVEYWTQSYTASQFKTLCEYLPNGFGTAYNSLMSEPLMDLKRIKDMTADWDNKGYYFVAEALSIFTWQIITDVWGDMPYFEALRGEEGIFHPKQDKGDVIYADLMKRIDDLLKLDVSNYSINGDQDFIYNGDLSKWYIFANTLKLKLMIRLSEAGNYDNAAVLAHIEKGNMLTESASIPGSTWDASQAGKRHPMQAFQQGGANYITTNVRACKTFIDYLNENSDPRLSRLFSGGNYRGAFFGDFDSKVKSDGATPDNEVTYAGIVFDANPDLPLMSAWEVNFYIAEVYARAGNHAKAKEFYDAGVRASLNQHGISNDAIIDPIIGGYAVWQNGTIEEEIKQISMQRWVAHCNYQHIESFLERNRTKYPPVHDIDIKANRVKAYENFPVGYLTISVNGRQLLREQLPAAPTYPETYISRNSNSPAQKPDVGQKVWWNKKAGK